MSKVPVTASEDELEALLLVSRLRAAATGRDEWRVQNPVDRSYCNVFTRNDYAWPEQEAYAWLESFKSRHPDHQYAKYVVAKVRVLSYADRLMIEAADELERIAKG